jgi:hypothetical protein
MHASPKEQHDFNISLDSTQFAFWYVTKQIKLYYNFDKLTTVANSKSEKKHPRQTHTCEHKCEKRCTEYQAYDTITILQLLDISRLPTDKHW